METAIWIIACIVLLFIAGFQARKIKTFRNLSNSQRNLIDLQRETIDLQRETIANQNGTIETYKSILAGGVQFDGKPIWLDSKLIAEVKELWNTTNKRVEAARKIQAISLENGKKLTLQETCDFIHKHCLK